MSYIAAISGTSRPGNYTSRALRVTTEELEARGLTVKTWDPTQKLLSFPGEETSDDALALTELVRNASAVILASPEYHGTFSAMTKLILENLGFPSALKGKPLALLGVAQGRIGAIKTIEQLRGVAAHMGAITLPFAVSIAGVQNLAFEPKEDLALETRRALTGLAEALIDFMKTYVCPKYELEQTLRGGKVEPWVGVL